MNTKDNLHMPIPDIMSLQYYFMKNYIDLNLPILLIPHWLKIDLSLLPALLNPSIVSIYETLSISSIPLAKYIICLLLLHFILPLSYPNSSWIDSIAKDFILTIAKYELYQSTLNIALSNKTRVMDNSTNVYVLRDRFLFIGDIKLCLIGADISTIIGLNKSEGIGLVEIQSYDNNSHLYKVMLHDALYFYDSPVNVISISKLALDYHDSKMDI